MMKKQFEGIEATYLFCPKCGKLMPVRKKLLLVLTDGELWSYLCVGCGNPIGRKEEKTKKGKFPPNN
jgi:DNA-directed RNA polymerase subunit RPC12/RpoP